jgi:hypothetical protein
MELHLKNKTLKIIYVFLVAAISLHFWSFKLIDDMTYQVLEAVVLFSFMLILAASSKVFMSNGPMFKNYVYLFMLIPLLSMIGAYYYHGQSLRLSLLVLRGNLFWLFYFVLHLLNISARQIIRVMLIIGLVWIFLTVVEQFTYPVYYFYSRDDENSSLIRADIYRFMISGRQFGLFVLLFFFYRYLVTSKIHNLVFVAFGLAGFYFYGTRQFAGAALICMCASVFMLKGRAKWRYVVLMFGLGAIIYTYKEPLLEKFIQLTSDQLETTDNVRLLAGKFFLNDYWPGWGAKLIGNGPAHFESDYGREMFGINTFLHYYRTDVGIIGAYNQFGIFYVLNIIFLNIFALRLTFRSKHNRYLKLFFLEALILLIINETYSNERFIPFYCLLFYLVDKTTVDEKRSIAYQQRRATGQPALA